MITINVGDCRDVLRSLPDQSVHCVVTSPPYWGLRDYGIPPSIWGGEDGCEHAFADETMVRQIRKGMGLEELGKKWRGGKKHGRLATTFEITTGTCVHCGAWPRAHPGKAGR